MIINTLPINTIDPLITATAANKPKIM